MGDSIIIDSYTIETSAVEDLEGASYTIGGPIIFFSKQEQEIFELYLTSAFETLDNNPKLIRHTTI
jgi:hypothetical protein